MSGLRQKIGYKPMFGWLPVWGGLLMTAPGWADGCEPGQSVTKQFTAVGYGTAVGMTEGQRQLMAIRAGKMDAYRTLVEQVHGFRISGSTTVSSMMVKSDQFRTYVDGKLRGVKVVSVQPIMEDSYEVTVEMEMRIPEDELSCRESALTSTPRQEANYPSVFVSGREVDQGAARVE